MAISTGKSAPCYLAAWMGGEFGGEWIHVYVWLSLCCSPETLTTLLIGYMPIQNEKFKKKKLPVHLRFIVQQIYPT